MYHFNGENYYWMEVTYILILNLEMEHYQKNSIII